ncbi:hypothetical protein OHT52_12495 [Streptomyces sp. NBC_00247]|uniref:hypothetical protein n=1 Tax=Streptomyces sp. NBC_00247 TaxID=2975689 RepID=UPI002E2CEF5D|nr:hypothetical protein [Streptomyces sp. NBC_00247]
MVSQVIANSAAVRPRWADRAGTAAPGPAAGPGRRLVVDGREAGPGSRASPA